MVMKDLKRFLATLVAICTLSAGALASDWQRQPGQKPPPKEQKEIPREDKKPPRRARTTPTGGRQKGETLDCSCGRTHALTAARA